MTAHSLIHFFYCNRWQIVEQTILGYTVQFLENNQLQADKSNSSLCCATSHHPDVEYFPIITFPTVCFIPLIKSSPWQRLDLWNLLHTQHFIGGCCKVRRSEQCQFCSSSRHFRNPLQFRYLRNNWNSVFQKGASLSV